MGEEEKKVEEGYNSLINSMMFVTLISGQGVFLRILKCLSFVRMNDKGGACVQRPTAL